MIAGQECQEALERATGLRLLEIARIIGSQKANLASSSWTFA